MTSIAAKADAITALDGFMARPSGPVANGSRRRFAPAR